MIVSHVFVLRTCLVQIKGCKMKLDKKNRLISAAIEAFNEKGLEQTKIADIVKIAGVAQGTYYLYFPSKLAIMPAIAEVVVEKNIAELHQGMDPTLPYSEQLNQLIEISFSITEKYADVIALTYAGLASSEHLNEWEKIYEPYYLYVTDFLEQGIAKEAITAKMNPKATARLLIGLIENAAEQLYLYAETDDTAVEDQKEEVYQFAKRALGII